MTLPHHPIQRARERYGLTLTPADLASLQADIVAGRSLLIRRNDDGTAIHALRTAGQTVVAVTGSTGSIITFLPARATQVCPGVRRKRRAA